MYRPPFPRALAAGAALVLAAWAFFPVVLLAVHASDTHAVWTGADGLIGADGVLGADQLQYLAWARSIAGHGLAADLFTLAPSAHVYLEPVSGVVGGLLALGLPLVVGSLLAKAVAVVVLAAGAVAWVRRLLGGRPGAQAAAVVLALGTVTPAAAVVDWAQTGSARFRFDVYLLGDELDAASKLWGYVPAALSIGLLVVALLALERALGSRRSGPGTRIAGGRWLTGAALAGLLCAWLHPWQGITLALALVALALVRRRREELAAFAVVLGAVLVPLAYYVVLARADPTWRLAAHAEAVPRPPIAVLALCLGPLLGLAGLGVRRPRGALAEQALLVWIPAALLAYLVTDAFATHALQGISLPFAVLAVRGATRLRAPAVLGWLCVGLLTVPGLAYDARKFVRVSDSPLVQYALPDSDGAALRFVARSAPPGGVLAPIPLATVIPSQTGRAVWVGHGDWSPAYRLRAREADRLFAGRMSPRAARAFVAVTGARILVAGCAQRSSAVWSALAPSLQATRRFGCATVGVLRPPDRPPRR